jgi:hypothetical protein
MKDQIQITLIATGFDLDEKAKIRQVELGDTRAAVRPPEVRPDFDDNDLDIPSFLRRRP